MSEAADRLKHRLSTGTLGGDQDSRDVEQVIAENGRLNKMRTHCENCGADYMATGIESGCPCLLKAALAQKTRECEELKKQVHRDGWYLVSADRPVEWLNGACYQREGEANSSANCASWYESAVFQRLESERLKAQVEQLGRQVAPVTKEELFSFGLETCEDAINNWLASRARTK